jgi:hypothetical protein
MWEPCTLTVWVPDEDDDTPPRRRSSPPLPNPSSVSTPQYYVIRYPTIGGVSSTYIQKVMPNQSSPVKPFSLVPQTYPNRNRPAQGTCNPNSNPNPHPNSNPSPHHNPNPTPNPQSDNHSSQRVNSANRREPATPAKKTGSNVTKSNKGTPLKSILKTNSASAKKVRFANPLAKTMSAPGAQVRRPSPTAATRGNNTPRSMPSSPIRPESQRRQGAQNNSQQRPQNNMEGWEVSSSSSSHEDDDPTIPHALHTPPRGTRTGTWQFPPTNSPKTWIGNENTNAGNSGNSSNLGRRRGPQPRPVRLNSPPPEYTSSPGNSPPLSSGSRGSRRSNWDQDSETDDNIDDYGHDYLSAGGVAQAKIAHLPRYHNSGRRSSSRRSSRRWEYIPIYLGARNRDARGWSYRPHIRHFPASFENLRNTFDNQANHTTNNNNNNGTSNGGTDALKPPRPTVDDAPDDVQW